MGKAPKNHPCSAKSNQLLIIAAFLSLLALARSYSHRRLSVIIIQAGQERLACQLIFVQHCCDSRYK